MPPVRMKERGRVKKGTTKRMIKYLFKTRPGGLIFSACCIVIVLLGNLGSSIFTNFVTQVLTQGIILGKNPFTDMFATEFLNFTINTNLTYLLIILGCVYTTSMLANYLQTRTMAILTQNFLNGFRKHIFKKMEKLPIKYFDTHQNGDIMSIYTNDIDTVRQFISQALPTIFQSGIMIICLIGVMMSLSIWLLLVVFAGTICMFFNTKVIGGRASKYFIKQQQSIGKIEGNIEESITGLKVIKVFTHEEESKAQFNELNEELCENATTANIAGNIMGPINGNIGNFVYVGCAIVACILYLTPGLYNWTLIGFTKIETATFYSTLFSFLMMSRMFANNVNNLSQNITFVVMGMAGCARCFALLDEVEEKDEGYVELVNVKKDENGNLIETNERTRLYAWKHPHKATGEVTYTELKGDILLDHVDFGYVPEKIVLNDVSIYAHPGQKIAFVGATGAGKTTITNLINRFYDIQDGKIRYDGININKIKKDDLRRSLGIVLQDTNLFTGTIMDNIRYGRLDATDEECIEAAKIANAYDFIMRLPHGFDTELRGAGSNLSQGQCQLLSIARAACADAPVMILDEATSSIDTRTEMLVQKGTDQLMEGRTVFVIAHRLSTVQNANAIMVLDHGSIIERGTHDDLINQKGVYYQLYTGAFELE